MEELSPVWRRLAPGNVAIPSKTEKTAVHPPGNVVYDEKGGDNRGRAVPGKRFGPGAIPGVFASARPAQPGPQAAGEVRPVGPGAAHAVAGVSITRSDSAGRGVRAGRLVAEGFRDDHGRRGPALQPGQARRGPGAIAVDVARRDLDAPRGLAGGRPVVAEPAGPAARAVGRAAPATASSASRAGSGPRMSATASRTRQPCPSESAATTISRPSTSPPTCSGWPRPGRRRRSAPGATRSPTPRPPRFREARLRRRWE
jgi:hypothetical protein